TRKEANFQLGGVQLPFPPVLDPAKPGHVRPENLAELVKGIKDKMATIRKTNPGAALKLLELGGHGSCQGLYVGTEPFPNDDEQAPAKITYLDEAHLDTVIDELKDLPWVPPQQGRVIILSACNTGTGKRGLVQKLANE